MGGKVEFRILGPLEVWAGGVRLRLRGPRQAKALAVLLLGAGRVVTFAELIEAVWDDPPATARRQIQDLVPSLRRALTDHCGRDVISTERTGYILRLETDELDAHRFEALVASAGGTPEPAAAAQLYRSALALCRGPTLAGIDSHALEPAVARWEERRLTVWEECLAAELAAGRRDGMVADLRSLVAQSPLRERAVELLMLALWRDDRCSALEAYQQYRHRLAEETGLDPSTKLIDLYQAVLRDDRRRSILSPNPIGPSQPIGPGRPAQLPPDVPAFAG
ncbi:MAG TPA: AfsR/SARP family transcriptional regulator, partial [Micromonosporaceae bacterium]|nr:AfsR/SARP family transcriptional regulator [Micromonosporaceae bacterium]